MAYLPPTGSSVDAAFSGVYVAPDGGAITFAFADTTVSSSGTLVVLEGGGPDGASMVGSVVTISSGVLAASETGADVARITEKEYTRGSLVVTELLTDSAAMHGTARASGLFAAQEEALDAFSALILVPVSGAIISTEEGGDTAVFLAKAPAKGEFAIAESLPADGIALLGKALLRGSFSVLESGVDLASVLGKAPVDFERALWGDLVVSCIEESVLAEVAPSTFEVVFDVGIFSIEME